MTRTDDDLPLLAWQPPTATVIPFPIKRDIGLARRVAAAVLKRKSAEAQQAEFARSSEALAKRLRQNGLTDAQIKAQLDQLANTVNAELVRLQLGGRRRSPGSA